MKANELRIGNYIQTDNSTVNFMDIIKVNSISNWGINESGAYPDGTIDWDYNLDSLHGIPLTEEWLLKFGFEITYSDNGFTCLDLSKNKMYGFNIKSNNLIGDSMTGFRHGEGMYYPFIKHVHQLQNLYFALTGEELTINEIVI